MRKLKITGVIRTVLLVLTVTGILLFFLLTAMDRRKLQRTVIHIFQNIRLSYTQLINCK